MNCPRCDGLAVSDYSIDQQAGPLSAGFHGWRCINCGMISDDVIHENQLTSLALRKSRGSVLSLSFVEPNKRDRPKKPDEPAPRHAPGNGFFISPWSS
jgi:hypothetical protein